MNQSRFSFRNLIRSYSSMEGNSTGVTIGISRNVGRQESKVCFDKKTGCL